MVRRLIQAEQEPGTGRVRALLWPASGRWTRIALFAFFLVAAGAVLSGAGWVRTLYDNAPQVNGLLIAAAVVGMLLMVRVLRSNHEHLARSRGQRKDETRFRSLVQHGSDIILVIDAGGRIQYISPSLERVAGVAPEDLHDAELIEYLHPDDRAVAMTFLQQAVSRPGFSGTVEVRILNTNGEWLHVEAACSNQLHNPSVQGLVINARDVTDRKRLEAKLVWQANHDALTGLANRKLFLEELEASLSGDSTGRSVGVLFLDLDGFKQVNDELGHTTGDHLLTMLAERLRACADDEAIVARLGGDEFTVLLKSVSGYGEASGVASRIQEILDEPYSIDGHVVMVTPSIGIALGTPQLDAGDDVLRRADAMMFRSKALRRSRQTRAGVDLSDEPDDTYMLTDTAELPMIQSVTPDHVHT